jgi:hypothetical protein
LRKRGRIGRWGDGERRSGKIFNYQPGSPSVYSEGDESERCAKYPRMNYRRDFQKRRMEERKPTIMLVHPLMLWKYSDTILVKWGWNYLTIKSL